MDAHRWDDAGTPARTPHAKILVALAPRRAVGLAQHELAARSAGRQSGEECDPFLGEHNVARLAALAGTHLQRPGVGVEVVDLQASELAVTGPGRQRGLEELAEVQRRDIHQALRFRHGEVTNTGGIDPFERLHLPPGRVRSDLAIAIGQIERSKEYRADTIGAYPPTP